MSSYVIPRSGIAPTIKVINSYEKIADFTSGQTVISTKALTELKALTSFTQLRWHCYKARVGRTIDIITAKNVQGEAYVKYFSSSSTTKPTVACGSFYKGSDDTSFLSQNCAKWSKSYTKKSTYDHPFFIAGKSHFMIINIRVECDDYDISNSNLSPGDFWKVYIR